MDNIIENNKIIAEFMGFKLQDNPNERWHGQWLAEPNSAWNNRIEILHFDSDWNWLIPVAEKIVNYCGDNNEDECIGRIMESLSHFDKEEVCTECVKFIKWHNSQPKD